MKQKKTIGFEIREIPLGQNRKSTKRKEKHRKTVPLLLLAAVLLPVSAAAGFFFLRGKAAQPIRIKDAEDAIRQLVAVGKDADYENAFSELTELHTSELGGDTFYRLQQNYEGIPVFGNTVVCVTGEDGECLSLTHNLVDIPEGFDTEPELTPEESVEYAIRALSLTGKTSVVAETPELCIFSPSDRAEAYLCYDVSLQGLRLLIDAQDGSVRHQSVQFRQDEAQICFNGGDSFTGWQQDDGSYVLVDRENEIYFFDAENHKYFNPHTVFGGYTLEAWHLRPITSPDPVFGDGNDTPNPLQPNGSGGTVNTAEELRSYLLNIRTWFRRHGGDPLKDPIFVVYNDYIDLLYGGKNAAASWGYPHEFVHELPPDFDLSENPRVGWITFGSDYSADPESHLDILAHEYTHIVSGLLVDWQDTNRQTGAINEAFSDLFGELCEAWIMGWSEPDWRHGNRWMDNPAANGYPTYMGEQMGELKEDYAHSYSTVLTHAAYNMWNGMDGTTSKKLSTDELGELWYRTMLMLPSNADFSVLRSVMTVAADNMPLTDDQRDCIRESLNEAHIFDRQDASGWYCKLDTGFTAYVFDDAGDPIDDFTLIIEQDGDPAQTVLTPNVRKTVNAVDADGVFCKLEEGRYRITVVTGDDPAVSSSFTVLVEKGESETLDYFLPIVSEEPQPVETPEAEPEAPVEPPKSEEGQPPGDAMKETPGDSREEPAGGVTKEPPASDMKEPPGGKGEEQPAEDAPMDEIPTYEFVLWDRTYRDEEGFAWYTYSYQYIVLHGDSPAIDRINKQLYTHAEKYMTALSDEQLAEPIYYVGLDTRASCIKEGRSYVNYIGNGIVSITVYLTENAGGNTGTTQVITRNFSLRTGEERSAAEIMGMDEATLQARLQDIIWIYVSETHAYSWAEYEKEDIYRFTLEDMHLTFSEEGELIMKFSKYQLGSGADGVYEIPSGIMIPSQ